MSEKPPAIGVSDAHLTLRFGRFAFGDAEQLSVRRPTDEERNEPFASPWTMDALGEKLRALALLNAGSETEQTLVDVGETLAAGLSGGVHRDLSAAEHLLIGSEPDGDDVQRLPWELLVPPGSRIALGVEPDRAVVRQVHRSAGRLPAEGPTPCVLFAWSEAGGGVPHKNHLRALQRGPLEVVELPDATPDAIQNRIRALTDAGRPPWLVHVLCHGTLAERGLTGLALGRRAYEGHRPSGAHLGGTLAHAPAPALLSVAACHRAELDGGALGPLLASLSRNAGVPVLGSQLPLGRSASVDALNALVQAWREGRTIVAMAQAVRLALRGAHSKTADWAALSLVLPEYAPEHLTAMASDAVALTRALTTLPAAELTELAEDALKAPVAELWGQNDTKHARARSLIRWASRQPGGLDRLRSALGHAAGSIMSEASENPASDALVRDLCGLSDTQWGEVLEAIGPGVRSRIPGGQASRREIARDLARRAAGSSALQGTIEAVMRDQGTLGGWEVTQAWLDAVHEDCRAVPIVGFRDRDRFRLSIREVYVPLQLSAADLPRAEPMKREERADLEAHVGETRIADAFAELERRVAAGARLRGLAIVGDPGSGKTTLLKHVLCCVRDGEDLNLPAGLTPVFLRCSRLAEVVVERPKGLLLPKMIEHAASIDFPGAGRAVRPEAGPFLFLLDGLDEVSDEATRKKVAAWLTREMSRWPGSRFVVSCRRAAWVRARERLRPHLLTLKVMDFGEDDILAYVEAWFTEVLRGYGRVGRSEDERAEEAKQRASSLVGALKSAERAASGRLRRMAANPLMLSNICLVHYAIGRLPDARVELYRECLGLLLQAWAEHKELGHGLPHRDAMLVLAPLAWAMQEAGDGKETTHLPRSDVVQHIQGPMATTRSFRETAPEALLQQLHEQCGVLVESDVDRYAFPHLTFQEYLAARHAQGQNGARELAERMQEPRWREPILLAMGLEGMFAPFIEAALEREDVPDHEALLRECLTDALQVQPEPFEGFLRRAHPRPPPTWIERLRARWGGVPLPPPAPSVEAVATVLKLAQQARLPGIEAVVQPLTDHPSAQVQALARSLCGQPEAPRADRPPADPAPGTLWRVSGLGVEFVWVPPGRFLMGATTQEGAEGYDPGAYSDESPPHRVRIKDGFWLGRFPVTVAQYRAFVAANDDVEEPRIFRDSDYNQDGQPVTTVSWHDARRFCVWLGTQLQAEVELPTEAEWEWAARGEDGRRYPWGKQDPDPQRANFASSRLEPVGGRPLGRGPFNAEEQAGGVLEWCRDVYAAYPSDIEELVDNCRHDDASEAPRVLRGGSWLSDPWNLRCAYRRWNGPGSRFPHFGFRLCVRFPPSTRFEPR
ncbi:MAG: SUMF1/EgtB/PvdO family nonheme iron enzyme [Alphaproteobacteria bacterium]|nr:SUMF1/EgtB/PvdO family nonheme iron enzyme [Alphaproteobacteria bacterium]